MYYFRRVECKSMRKAEALVWAFLYLYQFRLGRALVASNFLLLTILTLLAL